MELELGFDLTDVEDFATLEIRVSALGRMTYKTLVRIGVEDKDMLDFFLNIGQYYKPEVLFLHDCAQKLRGLHGPHMLCA